MIMTINYISENNLLRSQTLLVGAAVLCVRVHKLLQSAVCLAVCGGSRTHAFDRFVQILSFVYSMKRAVVLKCGFVCVFEDSDPS